MTYKVARAFLKEQQSSIMADQAKGRGTYPSEALAAGFALLPYAKDYNETRADIASRIFVQLLGSSAFTGISVNSLYRQAAEYADGLLEALNEDLYEDFSEREREVVQ